VPLIEGADLDEWMIVAKVFWWRDGGPGDVQENVFWGEGVVVVLTPERQKQVEALLGELPNVAVARRRVQPQHDQERRQERIVRSL
jgi:hypothetical protein